MTKKDITGIFNSPDDDEGSKGGSSDDGKPGMDKMGMPAPKDKDDIWGASDEED